MEIRGKMKVQPIDIDPPTGRVAIRADPGKPVLKSRLRKLFDRPFPNVLKNSTAEKPIAAGEAAQFIINKDGFSEFEPSSICLAKMVQSFIEESNEKQLSVATAVKNGRNRCNCFNGNNNDSSDDESDDFGGGFGETVTIGSSGADVYDLLKSLILCASVAERNLLADTAKIVEKNNKIHKRKDDLRKVVTDGLSSLGYDSSICKSKWEKSPSHPAGEYEYIDVMVENERLVIDIDFRSEFEIARSTGMYKTILQLIPNIFVGKTDRLGQIVSIVSEAARQSLKKKGMHFPPWRKAEYMRAKWLSPHIRSKPPNPSVKEIEITNMEENENNEESPTETDCGELELIFGDEETMITSGESNSIASSPPPQEGLYGGKKAALTVTPWQPPAIKPKSLDRGAKIVTGLASILKENP
ncbi:hypothetical protein IC582_010206 [Cucumis melo]|uniref:Uncharacterized protein LOC103491218 isoform X2 n=1 Tax=Cucumis melo TaxID=3656 RepID=A0A1S3BMC1_CUCME|nr:uncharacterized protein LOC103491218 isoform X2 [Cucumis melo]